MSENNLPSVMFLVSDYLPNHSGGTVRVVKNIKYFSKSEVICKVFVPDLNGIGYCSNINNVEIFRSSPYDLGKAFLKFKSKFKIKNKNYRGTGKNNSGNDAGRMLDKYLVPDVFIFWAIISSYKLFKIIKNNSTRIIYSSSPAASNHILALLLSVFWRVRFKWLVEYRDPWTQNPFRSKKNRIADSVDNWLEEQVLRKCDSIIVTSSYYKTQLLKKYDFLLPNNIHHIPNGYDPDDFKFLNTLKNIPNENLTIVSAGGYYSKRSLMPFILAFEKVFICNPELVGKIKFKHFGSLDAASENYLRINPILGINVYNSIPHSECIKELFQADCLLLIPGPGKGTIPGKTFEYLAVMTPVLAIVDDGPVKDIIEDLKVGRCFHEDDIEEIKGAIISLYERPINIDKYSVMQFLKGYDRKVIAESTLNIIKGLA